MRRTKCHVPAQSCLPVMLFRSVVCFDLIANGPVRAVSLAQCVTGVLARSPGSALRSEQCPLAVHLLCALIAGCAIARCGWLSLYAGKTDDTPRIGAAQNRLPILLAWAIAMLLAQHLSMAYAHASCAGYLRHLPRAVGAGRRMIGITCNLNTLSLELVGIPRRGVHPSRGASIEFNLTAITEESKGGGSLIKDSRPPTPFPCSLWRTRVNSTASPAPTSI